LLQYGKYGCEIQQCPLGFYMVHQGQGIVVTMIITTWVGFV